MDEVEGKRKIQTNLGLCEGVERRVWRRGGEGGEWGKEERKKKMRMT